MGSAVWQRRKTIQIHETTTYTVAVHFLPLELGAAGRCQLFKTPVKVLLFSQSCILPLLISNPGAAGGNKYLHTSSWILLYCSWSATVCSSWELRAGKKEQYFSIATDNLFLTDRWWISTAHSVQISVNLGRFCLARTTVCTLRNTVVLMIFLSRQVEIGIQMGLRSPFLLKCF